MFLLFISYFISLFFYSFFLRRRIHTSLRNCRFAITACFLECAYKIIGEEIFETDVKTTGDDDGTKEDDALVETHSTWRRGRVKRFADHVFRRL